MTPSASTPSGPLSSVCAGRLLSGWGEYPAECLEAGGSSGSHDAGCGDAQAQPAERGEGQQAGWRAAARAQDSPQREQEQHGGGGRPPPNRPAPRNPARTRPPGPAPTTPGPARPPHRRPQSSLAVRVLVHCLVPPSLLPPGQGCLIGPPCAEGGTARPGESDLRLA